LLEQSLRQQNQLFFLVIFTREVIDLLAFFFYTLLAGNCLSRSFASAGIAASALTANRQAPFVTKASVAVYIAKASDILKNLSAKLTSHSIVAVDYLRYPAKLVFGEFAGLCILIYLGLFQNLL
jgi:hypothetical protein